MMFSVCVSANAAYVYNKNVHDYIDSMGDYKYVLEDMSQQIEQKHGIAPKVIVENSYYHPQEIIEICTRFDPNDYVILNISTYDDGSYLSHSLLYPDEYVSVFDSKFSKKVTKAIKPYVSVGDYSGATESFLEVFDKHIENVNKHPVNAWLKKQLYKHYFLFIGFAIVFMVGLITAVSVVNSHKRKLKNLKSASDAFYYIDSEFLQISASREKPESIIDSIFDV